ncbi:putative sodium-coupled neutral amino acid transporter 11 [Penaeus japonicus]|uniref:putative sodium-coupled neutral amino acid transporter 11 n=1 Tax=Penaeus japonicus TaxID=27405 RepID=UPI001C712850|nr:putative sodium-coupled neutral amino acid transporter 11 [Penaeus japonicus]
MTTTSPFPANERTYILEEPMPPPQPPPQLATPDSPPKIPKGMAGCEDDDDPKREKSSISFTSFNYINSIVGSGVIGMPLALHEAGFGVGLLLLVLVSIITDASLCLMISVSRTVQANTYQELVSRAFGKPGFIVTSCLQFLYPFISLISYNIIVGDTMTKVLIRVTGIGEESVLARREFIMAASTLLITLPLSLYRNITRLAKISLTSVAMIVVIVVAMLVRMSTMRDIVPATPDAWQFGGNNLASAIGIMSFAFMCHHSSFLVYESLADNTQERWNKPTDISAYFCLYLCMLVLINAHSHLQPTQNANPCPFFIHIHSFYSRVSESNLICVEMLENSKTEDKSGPLKDLDSELAYTICGKTCCGVSESNLICVEMLENSKTEDKSGPLKGDVFENYCWADDLMNICRGFYAVTILLTFPIECFVARDVLETAFFQDYQPQPFFRHAVLSVLIALLCMLLSLATDCLGIVLELNGIMCAVPLAYILPALCYIKLEEGPLWAQSKWTAWGVAIFGVTSAMVGTVSLFRNIEVLAECSHGTQMPYCLSGVNDTAVEFNF